MPTWVSLLAAAVVGLAAGFEGWALWRIYRTQKVPTLLMGAVLLWLLGLGLSLTIALGEFGLLP